ncbi:putative polysaccharide biosynthesis protein [Virgibacillus halodenitrificans]|uniref:putative polysaccharide biosynthesis protein n=1 Tax=Virgibacillus halodenitrificans TaxID=1482 RepID=UPI000760FC59|nr:polysaccharide biosynthesis protein [Virgibacillus halodenitrificans]MCJ0931806.1 polysaccharide biosynthesis protein [Virgibacillus halodenitrificans]MEC2159795.1 polysaccharide biosynthesis protein [Virgibacillus halodenitrificans]WHX27801.1 polysaccharide biosynthesis protein [Virgibacillus halodenitrificans]
MSNIVRGTMLLTGASFLSKFLGMIYVIPFNALVGETGGTLFAYAYTPYSIFISISTVGVPLAVSKFVSKYNAVGDYETGMRMFKAGISLMAVTGFLAFLTMFFSADWLAGRMITSDDPVNITVNDVAFVIRMVSVALIVIPAMSIVRGFFQGHNSMGPTAVSQVVEQIIRIVFLLGGAFVILKFMNGTITAAVGFSTFAAFIGAMASCLVLFVYWKKRKTYLNRQIEQQTYTHEIPKKDLFIEIFRYAGPFVLVGLAIPLYQMVDQFTFERAMVAADQKDIWEFAYSAINFYGHKLVIIPITLATGLSLAILPTLTNSYTQQNRQLLNKQINQALQIILVLVIPAVVGMSMLANEAYGSLYGMGKIETTGTLLAWYAPVALLFALFSVSSSILQGINQQKYAVFSLLAGLLIKVLFNIQLIYIFGAKGAIFGTALAAGTAVAMNLWRIRSAIDFSFKEIIKRTILIGIFILFMCIAILLTKYIFGFFLPFEEQRWAALVMLIIGVGIGGMVYLWFAYKSTLLERVLGEKVRFLDRFLSK